MMIMEHPQEHIPLPKTEPHDADDTDLVSSDGLVKHESNDSDSSSPSPDILPPALQQAQPHQTTTSGHRRPTRKSTLTQQQKNQKRQRATQDQLGTLEVEFNLNPTPNASVRERIALEINMTERSVQIWFQNRRAKIKNIAKKSIENGEECDAIPESMRRYLAMQALESGSPMANAEFFVNGGLGTYANTLLMNGDSNASKVMIHHLTCRSLTIGTWRRIGQTQLDLVVFYCPTKSMVTYYIQADSTGFRIEYPFSSIKSITLDAGDRSDGAEASTPERGCLVVELIRPPFFTMDRGSNGWFTCVDFTEDQQASKTLIHRLGGHPKVLGTQLSKLTTTEAYINRFANSAPPAGPPPLPPPPPPMPVEDIKPCLASPLPLIDNRPSSQPSHIIHPQSASFHDPRTFHMGPPPPRGHKRQRSRSVPVAIEFGPRRQIPPPFMIQLQHQHQHQHHHVHHVNPVQANHNHNPSPNPNPTQQNHIFAPVPQYAQQVSYQPPFGGAQTPFQIDPSAGFNFDFNTPAPPSTTTGTTGTTPPSSEFEHSFLAPSFAPEQPVSAPVLQQPFPLPQQRFLSPVAASPNNTHETSVSPMSALGHPLEQQTQISPLLSPPSIGHNPLFRSASADPRAPISHNSEGYYDLFDFNNDTFTMNSKVSGFDEPYLSNDFAESITWPPDPTSSLEALLVDDPLLDSSKQPLSLPIRMSFPEQPKGPLPPATPPPASDVYEFADLVRLDPLSPEQDRVSAA